MRTFGWCGPQPGGARDDQHHHLCPVEYVSQVGVRHRCSCVNHEPSGEAAGNRKGAPLGRGLDAATIANDATTETRDEVLSMWQARGPAVVFGSPRQPDPPGEWADRLVWDKKRPGMNGGPWRYRHESIYVTAGFVRTDNAAVSIIEAWPDQADHIHAKPIGLMLRLVAAAPPGVIADPFAGSGSTLAACKQLGRHAIGVELDERYCEIAARRLSQDVLDFGSPAALHYLGTPSEKSGGAA